MVPEQFVVNGEIRGGQGAGMLGARFEPLFPGGDPNLPGYRPAIFAGQAPVDRELLHSRQQLLEALDQRQRRDEPAVRSFGEMHQKALGVLERGVQKAAFELDAARPNTVRRVPSQATVEDWIKEAKQLDKTVSH